MPVLQSPNHTYLSKTPQLPFFTQEEITTQGPLGLILKPKYEQMLKDKLAPLNVTLGPNTMVLPGILHDQDFMVYKGSNHIGWIGISKEQGGVQPRPFALYALILKGERNQSVSNPLGVIMMRGVGKALDEFAYKLNERLKVEKVETVVQNKNKVNVLKDRTGIVDIARNIGTMSGIVPAVKGVDIGQGRRKTRKSKNSRFRKQKKTRKH